MFQGKEPQADKNESDVSHITEVSVSSQLTKSNQIKPAGYYHSNEAILFCQPNIAPQIMCQVAALRYLN